jgi:site-specific DNA recombinase
MKYFHYIRKSTDDDEHQILSLESQERENLRRFAGEPGIDILTKIKESRSAKYPGRPLFNDMLDRIERGEADGIIAWDPDRLARNSVDGGRIIYLLDTGKLRDLKFSTYTFENTAQGKFMLQIVFANAKYHVDSLSNNVKRGNRTKVENGWWPHGAPIGYQNAPDPEPIIPDPARFPIVRRLFETMLTGAYTVPQLRLLAASEWGLRTFPHKRIGGKPLSISGLYRVLTNPFYAGILEWEGRRYPGKHEPMVSVEQFAAVQALIGRKSAARPKRHRFAYTGFMRCACGLGVTASNVTNRFGSKYTYYHCTRRRGAEFCREPYIQLPELEEQFGAFIRELTIHPSIHAWALRKVTDDAADAESAMRARRSALLESRNTNEAAQKNLRHLRTHDQITDAEFQADRNDLETERIGIDRELARLTPEEMLQPEEYFILFSIHAANWFEEGDDETKRLILETAGSNPVMAGGKLKIDAAYPFRRWKNPADISDVCTAVNDVRTHAQHAAFGTWIHRVRKLLQKFGEDSREIAA